MATLGGSSTKIATAILLNAPGVSSNPGTHQNALAAPMLLGSSGGNNNDYDQRGNAIVDCCSGTLGALVQDASGREYLLSNNHVLARSDHASVGDSIIQPGLIDNNCTPIGDGSGTVPCSSDCMAAHFVPCRQTWMPPSRKSHRIPSTPGATSSSLARGNRTARLQRRLPGFHRATARRKRNSAVACSQTCLTGLTCGKVSALDLDVVVDYYRDCAETRPYLTKTFTHQIAVSGDHFGDAGDSGALIVDTDNAEPVGLFFAGGIDGSGVSHGIANPAPEVLSALSTQMAGEAGFSFVGAADHEVSCLSYGDSTINAAQSRMLSDPEVHANRQRSIPHGRWSIHRLASWVLRPEKAATNKARPDSSSMLMRVSRRLFPRRWRECARS